MYTFNVTLHYIIFVGIYLLLIIIIIIIIAFNCLSYDTFRYLLIIINNNIYLSDLS